ncbi:uncharacterized protein VTP21DRAFT_7047 [Calcarisporiella thermophila]|uniref:uncharacterized protein n=1 Tax=Calcarisporiella thermophila TaxID=911321 RepID=UPI00374414AC
MEQGPRLDGCDLVPSEKPMARAPVIGPENSSGHERLNPRVSDDETHHAEGEGEEKERPRKWGRSHRAQREEEELHALGRAPKPPGSCPFRHEAVISGRRPRGRVARPTKQAICASLQPAPPPHGSTQARLEFAAQSHQNKLGKAGSVEEGLLIVTGPNSRRAEASKA